MTTTTATTPAQSTPAGADAATGLADSGLTGTGPGAIGPGEQACRAALRSYLDRAAEAPGESARSGLLAALVLQLCDAKLDYVEERAPETDCYVRVRGKDRVILGQPGQLYGSAVLVFQDDLGRAGRADEARQQLRRYLACLWSTEPAGRRRNYLCLATDGFRVDVSSPTAPEPGRPTIVPGEISLKRLTLMDLRTVPPAELSAWLDRALCRRQSLAATPANFSADFGASSHAWQTVCPELTRLWARLAVRPDCQEAFEAWRRTTATSLPPYQPAATQERFVLHTYLAMVARLVLMARLSPAAAFRAALDGSACAALGVQGLLTWPLLWWTALPEAGEAGALAAAALAGLLPAYGRSDGHGDALDALCGEMGDAAYRQAVTTAPWLASKVVDRLFGASGGASLADPACGQGAFLRAAAVRRRGSPATVGAADVLSGLAGLERDPLAATIAQVGLLLSLGPLTGGAAVPLSVPVYWTGMRAAPSGTAASKSSIKGRAGAAEPVLMVNGRGVRIPAALAADQGLCRRCLQALWPLLSEGAGPAATPSESALGAHLWLHCPELAREQQLRDDLMALAAELGSSGLPSRGEAGLQDALAALPLLFMRGRFQTAVARPRQAVRGAVGPGAAQDPVLGAAWEMVREGGSVACALPRAALGSPAYRGLRGGALPGARRGRGKGVHLGWQDIWDLEEAAPPGGQPFCVFFGERLAAAGQQRTEAAGLVWSRIGAPGGAGPEAVEHDAVTCRPVRFTLVRQRGGTAWSTESAEQVPLELEKSEGTEA